MFSKLEYQELKNSPKFNDYDLVPNAKLFQPSITQRFVQLFTEIKNGKNRVLLKAATGSGKTLMTLLKAKENSEIYSVLYKEFLMKRYVAVFGFSESVYKRELTKFPELGFITQKELAELSEIRKNISNSEKRENKLLFEKMYRNFVHRIKARCTDPEKGGYFIFYGYRKWHLRLFLNNDLPDHINAENVYEEYKKGNIPVNKKLLDSFAGSLLICDEIHMVYNSIEANSYGIALQLLLDYHGKNISALFLSATIINNNRREIINIANLVRDPGTKILRSNDYFGPKPEKKMTEVYKAFEDKTIFLEEVTDDYPTINFEGTMVKELGNKFVKTDMSKFHLATYKHYDLFENTTIHFIADDLAFPNPKFSAEEHKLWDPNHKNHKDRKPIYGLIDRREIEQEYVSADPQWLKKMGIEVIKTKDSVIISGPWLKRDSLAIYSTKYAKMVDDIHEDIKKDPELKTLIYHPYIVGSGVNLITEILKQNGFISYGSIPNENTISSITGKTKLQEDGKFYPSTIFSLNSSVSDKEKERILTLWNSKPERHGKNLKIFVGSQRIKQSVDFKNTSKLRVMHVSKNKGEQIQVFGRIVRTNSMIDLPKEKRIANINIYIYNGMTIEYKRYYRQQQEFLKIQKMEKHINEHAVNNYIYREDFESTNPFGQLSFPVDFKVPKINLIDYYDEKFKYAMSIVMVITKWAFLSNPVWTKKDLWEYVLNHPAANVYLEGITKSTKHIYEEIFDYCLHGLIYKKENNIVGYKLDLFDFDNNIFSEYVNCGKTFRSVNRAVVALGDYFILMPLDRYGNIEMGPYSFMRKQKQKTLNFVKLVKPETLSNGIIDYLDTFKQETKKSHYKFILNFTTEEHRNIMKNHIDKTYKIPEKFWNLYLGFGVAGDDFYLDDESTNRYENSVWSKYPLTSFDNVEENNFIIGIIQKKEMKLREPITTQVGDRRKMKQGQVCSTLKKESLKKICDKIKKTDFVYRVGSMCDVIFEYLVDSEMSARKSKHGKKYLYVL